MRALVHADQPATVSPVSNKRWALASSHTHKPLGPKAPPWPHLLMSLTLLLPTETTALAPSQALATALRLHPLGSGPLKPSVLHAKVLPFLSNPGHPSATTS